MKIFGFEINKITPEPDKIERYEEPRGIVNPEAYFLFGETFDGEKDPGSIGAIKDYWVDHAALSYRSWQAFLDSDVAQNILKKYIKWVVGSGLRLNADPDEVVLKSEGISIDEDTFSDLTESRFKIYSNSNFSNHSGESSLQMQANEAFKGAIIGGDILVINRIKNRNVTTQLIDGKFVTMPDQDHLNKVEKRGNRVVDGVEINKAGKHIAYFIEIEDFKHKRVLATVNGVRLTFLVYGSKYKTNDVRGVPLVTAILDTIAKLERYKEATVGSAEERQKIAYAIEHDVDGTGQNPLLNKLRQKTDVSIDVNGILESTRNLIVETTQKQAFNMPVGSSLKILESKNELFFESFMTVNMRFLCATVGIPFEVALSWYDSNYSASRAALKDWEHTLLVERSYFSNQFYKQIYSTWLDIEVLIGKINAPGYARAIVDKNEMAINAYKTASFIGANIPHIDPLKEVLAERAKLGSDTIPLTTAEAAAEALNSGDFKAILSQYKREFKEADGINEPPEPVIQNEPPKE